VDTSGDVERGSCWQLVETPFIINPVQDTLLAQCPFRLVSNRTKKKFKEMDVWVTLTVNLKSVRFAVW